MPSKNMVRTTAFASICIAANAATACETLVSLHVSPAEGGMGFAGKASTSCAFIVFPGRADGKACQWIFDYRSEAAQRYFQQMVAEVHACKGAVALPKDQPVNHPDSYELISYQLGNEVLTKLDAVRSRSERVVG